MNVWKQWQKKYGAVLALFLVVVMVSGCGGGAVQQQDVWGRAEAKEVDINSKIPGRVVGIFVQEGDRVEKGQLLARIDNRDITAQVQQAQAGIRALEDQTSQAGTVTELQDKTAQASLYSARAQWEKARADLQMAENDYQRFNQLVATGAVSQQSFESYKTKYQVAQAALSQAEGAVASAEAGLMQLQANRNNESAMRNKVEQAKATLQQVEVSLDETEIRAPFSGIVTVKYVEEGAMVSSGMPLVAVQDPMDNWVNLKVKETELSRYALQDKVELQGRDSQLKVNGTIVDISKKPEYATYRATSERGDSDIVTFNVKIRVNSEKVRPGMRFQILRSGK